MMNYKRVNKPTARKLYYMGCSILLLPCKVNDSVVEDCSSWISPVTISLLDSSYVNGFDRAVNEYEYYNCCNSELGYYAHYFVSIRELEISKLCDLMCK